MRPIESYVKVDPRAGKPAAPDELIDVGQLERAYYTLKPDNNDPHQLVSFGTSGHRGAPLSGTFNEPHILAITQAICEYRRTQGIDGPLFLGKDTHAASLWAERSALEVLAANGVETFYQQNDGYTPTPVISRGILAYNKGRKSGFADGMVITPSHNPPSDGGIKYNAVNGGPAETDVTKWIQERSNQLLRSDNAGVKRIALDAARRAATVHAHDFVGPYVADLGSVIDLEAIRAAGVKIGVDPLGGSSLAYWQAIGQRYQLDLAVVNSKVDPAFGFMTIDHDGKIRMDCSSPYAMAGLVNLRKQFDVAFGSDPDADRHGIVTSAGGLMNPNQYLAVAIRYLVQHRSGWPAGLAVGKTLVSSSVIDAVVKALGRKLVEVPVGFKYFAEGLFRGTYCFGGEESAGASFVRRDGSVWVTDKDGLIMGLLAAEMVATTGKDPFVQYEEISRQFGTYHYTRVDVPATLAAREALKKIRPDMITAADLAGDPLLEKLSHSPGTNLPIGGLKLVTRNGWFAVRPSGTEDKAKIYAESYRSAEHLQRLFEDGYGLVMSLEQKRS